MAITISPNMNLPIPVVGQEPGPDYAIDVNSALTLVDAHDHTPGNGVQITTLALNINADLTMNANSLTSIKSLVLSPDTATPAINTIYESGVDLYFKDGNGNAVRLTQSGAVAGTPGSIANLVAPASATYVGASSTFVWQSNTNIAADMDFGSAKLRNLTPNSTFALTLSPPAGLSSNYQIVLPTLPSSQKIMTLDNSGNMTAPYTVDDASITIIANVIQVKDLGVTTAKLNALAVTTAKIDNLAVTDAKLGPDSVIAGKIAANAVELGDIAANAVTASNFRTLPQITVFTSSGTFTTPANSSTSTVYQYEIIGAGSGGSYNGAATTGGGGGGAYARGTFTGVAPSTGISVTVGAGGAGGNSGGAGNSAAGGSSSIAAPVSVTCGGGGAVAAGANAPGGTGGSVTAGSPPVNIRGGSGNTGATVGGMGGGSFLGTGGNSPPPTVAGNNAIVRGTGGSGSSAPSPGGNGADGIVIITQLTP